MYVVLVTRIGETFFELPAHQAYKKTPESQDLAYDLHFWIGAETSQDEAGTAAYKTVELDDRTPFTVYTARPN